MAGALHNQISISTSQATDLSAGSSAQDVSAIDVLSSEWFDRTTLEGLQQLWRSHASAMDQQGTRFSDTLTKFQQKLLGDIGSLQSLDVKRLAQLIRDSSNTMVAAVADMFASTRDEEDRFSRAMYQSARTAFMRNIEGALTIRDAQYKQRLKQQRMTADKQMEAARAAFRVELQSRLELQRAELLRRFKAGGVSAAELDDAEAEPPLAAAASSRGFVGGSVAASARTTATALPGGGGGGDEEGQGSKWQEILSQLQASKDDLKAQNDKLQSSVAQLYKEVKSHKATAEAATERAEQVQQECMQIVGACEQHIMQLQTRYLEELAERDMLLKRCKDAIMMLEGQVKALQEGRGSPRGPAASGSSAVTGGTTATTLPGGSPVSPGRSRLSAGGGGAASTAR